MQHARENGGGKRSKCEGNKWAACAWKAGKRWRAGEGGAMHEVWQWQKKGTHKNEIGLQNNNCPTCDVCGYVLDWAGMGEVNKRALSFELYNGLQKDKAPKLFEKLYPSVH